jgi:diguanylate cyclase (GGDEF)-like protein
MKLDGSNLLVRKEITRLINSRMYFLKFPKKLEQRYSQQYKTEAAREFRLRGLIILILYIYLSFGIYEILSDVNVKEWFMLYSWVGVIIFAAWILSLFKQISQWFELYTCIGSSLAIAVTFAITGIVDGGGNVLFHAAMMYAVVIIYGFVGMRFYTASLAGWSGGIIGVVITSHFNGQLEWTLLQRTYTFSSLLGMCLAYATDHQHRENYLQSCLIELTRSKMLDQAKQLETLSQQDALTGLANRRHLDEMIKNEWNRSTRYRTPLTVMMIDIDYFKNYNDNLGHPEGDRCLKKIADAIAKIAARSGDLAARYGGEEFILIFAMTDQAHAIKQAELLIHLIHDLAIPHPSSSVSEFVTVSVGVASTVPQINQSHLDFIKRADLALYKAKNAGRNRYALADTPLNETNLSILA